MSDDFIERKDVIQWLDYMTGRLDEYEVERNEYLSAYTDQAPSSYRFFQDVVLGFAENILLMDNLAAGREEVQYVAEEDGWTQNRLRLRTVIVDEEGGEELKAKYKEAVAMAPTGEEEPDSTDGKGEICYPDRFPYLLRHRDFDESSPSRNNLNQALENKEIVGGEDVEIVLPNVHVFYSILENFIRNSAKHAEHLSSKKHLDVYLCVTNPGDDKGYYNLFLYDDVSEVTAETAVGFQRTIESELIEDESDKNEESSLGISDMKFSSFLMIDPAPGEMTEEKLSSHLSIFAFHGKTEGAIEDDRYTVLREAEDSRRSEADRIEALKENLDNGKTCNFGYRFKLAKSKKICWIGSSLADDEGGLRQHGIYRYNSLDNFRNPDDAVTMAAFDFAVFEPVALTGVSEEVFERALLQLPYRVLLAGSVDDGPPWFGDWLAENERRVQQTEADLPALQSEQLLRWCWREWLRRWHVEEGQVAQVHLYMENEEGVERWSFDEGKKSDFCNVELNLHSGASSGVLPGDEGSLIVYDRHGGLLKTGFQGPDDGEKIRERILESSHFCNSFDKNSSDFAPLFYPPADPENREYMLYQLVEAGLLRVFVLDERIAELAQKGEHKSMENALPRGKGNFWHQAAASNVFLITHVDGRKVVDGEKIGDRIDFKLDVSDGVSLYSGQEDLDVDEKCADALIIHRTFVKSLAERLLNGSVKSLIDRLRKSIPWIIVNSGTSHSLDSEALFKFMPFSQLDNQIQEVGLDHGCVLSKIQLAKRIMTLTRIQ
jgi:hypothetical protein